MTTFKGFTIQGEPRPKNVTELEQGQVFVSRRGNEAEIGMIASTDDGMGNGERVVAILGSTRRDAGAIYPVTFRTSEYDAGSVYPISSPRLVLSRGRYGFAEVSESRARSKVLVDPSNRPWIRLAISGAGGSPQFLDLSGGGIGRPREPCDYYGDWRMVWRPDGSDEDITLLEEKTIRPVE